MKKGIGLLIVILGIVISSFGQTNPPKEILIPEYILDSMINELIIKDHLVYTVNVQDSTIQVYKKDKENDLQKIQTLKLEKDSYEQIIKKMEELSLYDKAELQDCKKEAKRDKRRALGKGIVVGVVITIIGILATK